MATSEPAETTSTDAVEPTTGPPTQPTTGEPDSSTGDSSNGDSSTADSSTADSSTGEPVCLEFDEPTFRTPPSVQFTCNRTTKLCGDGAPVFFSPGPGDGWTVDDIERARCLVAAMRDRTIGTIEYQEPALGHDIHTLEILGDQVIVRNDHLQDFNWDYREEVRFLRPPGFFADCAEGTAFAVHACLEDGFTAECGTSLACPPD